MTRRPYRRAGLIEGALFNAGLLLLGLTLVILIGHV